MRLRRLTLVNFKNIASASPQFSAGLNCFVGENGAGKTNVLDAVHYLSMCRSSLGGTDRGSVRHGEEFFMIEGEYSDDAERNWNVVCSFSGGSGGSGNGSGSSAGSGGSGGPGGSFGSGNSEGSGHQEGQRSSGSGGSGGGKRVKCDGKEYERFSDHVGVVPMVMVSPADTFLISDAADERRRWLNAFISQLDRSYLQALMRYNAVLAERNRLLKKVGGFGISGNFGSNGRDEILEVLDMQLAAHGTVIHTRRAGIIERMRPLVADYYARLSDDRERVELTYRSEQNDRPAADLLAASREKDFACGFTTSGVHRDDITMRIGGLPLRRYGSQGQQKSFLIALKLAQFAVLREESGETPILLLDDLFDKLDTGRVERLISLVSGSDQNDGGQSNRNTPSGGDKNDDYQGDQNTPNGRNTLAAGQIFISDCNRARLEGVLERNGSEYSLFEIENGEVSSLVTHNS
jgi:DNA replication and repair protein RecF